ncbi:MAG: hypothetical protein K2G56_01865, partial [Eubacterium sp.]|nr:hypothetical protein [Eubacterium sp.]
MKRVLKILAYPLVAVLATAVNVALFVLSTSLAISLITPVSLIIYMFLGGIVLYKNKSRKSKLFSLLFTAGVLLAGGIASAFIVASGSDNGFWLSIFAFPFSISLAYIFQNHYSETVFLIAFVICAVMPVLVSYIASKIFEIKKKAVKNILIGVMVLICIGSAVQGAIGISRTIEGSVYENGDFYNAYFDMNGNKYASNEEVPYYDKNDKVYYQTYNHPPVKDSDDWAYVGEMTDEDGNEYDIEKFYVYADGYIFMDTDKTVLLREDLPDDVVTDWTWMDSEGNI